MVVYSSERQEQICPHQDTFALIVVDARNQLPPGPLWDSFRAARLPLERAAGADRRGTSRPGMPIVQIFQPSIRTTVRLPAGSDFSGLRRPGRSTSTIAPDPHRSTRVCSVGAGRYRARSLAARRMGFAGRSSPASASEQCGETAPAGKAARRSASPSRVVTAATLQPGFATDDAWTRSGRGFTAPVGDPMSRSGDWCSQIGVARITTVDARRFRLNP